VKMSRARERSVPVSGGVRWLLPWLVLVGDFPGDPSPEVMAFPTQEGAARLVEEGCSAEGIARHGRLAFEMYPLAADREASRVVRLVLARKEGVALGGIMMGQCPRLARRLRARG
jgi:hypothetical protein